MKGDLLTTKEVAERLGVSRAYVLKMVRLGKIQGVILPSSGKRRVIRIPQIEVIHIIQGRSGLDAPTKSGQEVK